MLKVYTGNSASYIHTKPLFFLAYVFFGMVKWDETEEKQQATQHWNLIIQSQTIEIYSNMFTLQSVHS